MFDLDWPLVNVLSIFRSLVRMRRRSEDVIVVAIQNSSDSLV